MEFNECAGFYSAGHICVVWQPHLLKDIRALEAVQRKVTRLSPNLAHLTYSDRLKY